MFTHYLKIFCDIALALMPLTMLINGMSLGFLIAEHLHENAAAKKSQPPQKKEGESK